MFMFVHPEGLLGFLCIRDTGRRGNKITVNEMKAVEINENIYCINSINIIISYNFQEGHDTSFFNVKFVRTKLRSSSVEVTEPVNGCDVNVRRIIVIRVVWKITMFVTINVEHITN